MQEGGRNDSSPSSTTSRSPFPSLNSTPPPSSPPNRAQANPDQWSGKQVIPAPKKTNAQPEEFEVDVDGLDKIGSKPPDTRFYKERAAREIAKWILIVFGIGLVGAFIVVMSLIVPTWYTDTKTVTTEFMPAMPNVLEIVKIIGGIFTPLLAFILGYYFSASARQDDSAK
jgi:hypothetical protein